MSFRREVEHLAKYVRDNVTFWPWLLLNRPVIWVDVGTGEEIREEWGRRERVGVFRPHYWGLLERQSCGCSRRRITRRVVLIAMDCEEHWGRATAS